MFKNTTKNLGYFSLLCLAYTLRAVPSRGREWISKPFGAGLSMLGKNAHSLVIRDYENIVPQQPHIQTDAVKELYRSIARMALDACVALASSPQAVAKAYKNVDLSPLLDAMEKSPIDENSGKPMGVVSPFSHIGSFPLIASVLANKGIKATLVGGYPPPVCLWQVD